MKLIWLGNLHSKREKKYIHVELMLKYTHTHIYIYIHIYIYNAYG